MRDARGKSEIRISPVLRSSGLFLKLRRQPREVSLRSVERVDTAEGGKSETMRKIQISKWAKQTPFPPLESVSDFLPLFTLHVSRFTLRIVSDFGFGHCLGRVDAIKPLNCI